MSVRPFMSTELKQYKLKGFLLAWYLHGELSSMIAARAKPLKRANCNYFMGREEEDIITIIDVKV